MAANPKSSAVMSHKLDAEHTENALVIEQVAEGETTLWTSMKENPRVIMFAFLANCGSFLFGYDILVQGAITALPMFSMTFGSPFGDQMILPALWQGLWQGFNAIGIMIGAASNGVVMDRFGRKIMFAVGGLVSSVGTALVYVASDVGGVDSRRGVLLAGKFVIGLGMGILMSTCQTYVSEISPPRLRTVLLGFYAFFITVGQMMAISVVFSRVTVMDSSALKIPFASQWAFSGYAVLVAVLVPESPVYLANCGKTEQARKAIQKLTPHASVDERISVILATSDQETTPDGEAATFADCFKGTDLRRTRIVAVLNTLQQLIGVSLIANSTYFFIMAGMSPTMSLTINQAGVGASMACTFISWFVIAKVGRRAAILVSFVCAGALFVGMGIAGFWPRDAQALRFIGVALVLAACCSNLGTGTAYPIVAAEIPATRLRAKTLGLGFAVNAFMMWAFNFVVPYMFNADQGNLGGKIGLVFAGFCVVGFVVSFFEIPETKDITYGRINELFQTRTPARKFRAMAVSYEAEDTAATGDA
ncbi:maltose permease MAL61 [Verticillium alfalfae VaMs.102]|uniref:Maltose permease MAL61 n=1 Tax=Verticillium alfalfae (strain VaMs.102 / ATCC MYA-4576 / FGSC 10136) TaxID=526221 RepID=C9SLE5_VERA1|nr:maltose permease MAL61 [Verticillium alfalfae VaMs.102]EEY19513.1 maltose permease MAL61 [Verticillium alfalfae VaMs.102]